MPFIGNQPAESYSAFQKQDFTVTATTSYTLDNPVANANELALFINFVRQEPTTAYSASGTSLTLTSATSVGDDMYCVYLGKAVQTVNPPNASVGTAQLIDNAVTDAKFSGTKGITLADQWRTSADNNYNDNDIITNNWERVDSVPWNANYIGNPLTQTSGVFTIPVTGMFLINYNFRGYHPSTTFSSMHITLQYDNGSGYESCSSVATENYNNGSNAPQNLGSAFMINASDSTRNFRFKFDTDNNGYTIQGNSTISETGFQIMRIGDNQ